MTRETYQFNVGKMNNEELLREWESVADLSRVCKSQNRFTYWNNRLIDTEKEMKKRSLMPVN